MDYEKKDVKDIRLACIASFLNADQFSKFKTMIHTTGDHFVLTGFGCKAYTGHDDMQYKLGMSPGYVMISSGLEEGKFYVYLCSHYLVHYNQQEKVALRRTILVKSFFPPAFSLFIRILYVLHAGAEYLDHSNLRKHD